MSELKLTGIAGEAIAPDLPVGFDPFSNSWLTSTHNLIEPNFLQGVSRSQAALGEEIIVAHDGVIQAPIYFKSGSSAKFGQWVFASCETTPPFTETPRFYTGTLADFLAGSITTGQYVLFGRLLADVNTSGDYGPILLFNSPHSLTMTAGADNGSASTVILGNGEIFYDRLQNGFDRELFFQGRLPSGLRTYGFRDAASATIWYVAYVVNFASQSGSGNAICDVSSNMMVTQTNVVFACTSGQRHRKVFLIQTNTVGVNAFETKFLFSINRTNSGSDTLASTLLIEPVTLFF